MTDSPAHSVILATPGYLAQSGLRPLSEPWLELLQEGEALKAAEDGVRYVAEAGHGWERAGRQMPWPSAVKLNAAGEVVAWA